MATYKKKTKSKENPTRHSMQVLNRQLSEGSFSKVYLLYGEERFLINQFRDSLLDALLPVSRDLNLTTYDSDSFDMSAMTNDMITLPFLAEHRVILVKDSGVFDRSDIDFIDYIDRMPEENVLIFCEDLSRVNRTKKPYLRLSKREDASCLEFAVPEMETLQQWLTALLSKDGVRVRAVVPDMIISAAGPDKNMYLLRNEAIKVHDYCLDKGEITAEDVELLCTNTVEDSIFEMCSAISEKNERKALNLYIKLRSQKADAVPMILLITRQFDQLMQVKERLLSGDDTGAIMSSFRVSAFVANKLIRTAGNYTINELINATNRCHDAFYAVKDKKFTDVNSVENLIVELLRS